MCRTDLLCPADTVMDLNIGAALWLAAQAEGELHGGGGWCRSGARVVLLGHGADELCGGYGRHRTAFRHQVEPNARVHVYNPGLSAMLVCLFGEVQWLRLSPHRLSPAGVTHDSSYLSTLHGSCHAHICVGQGLLMLSLRISSSVGPVTICRRSRA